MNASHGRHGNVTGMQLASTRLVATPVPVAPATQEMGRLVKVTIKLHANTGTIQPDNNHSPHCQPMTESAYDNTKIEHSNDVNTLQSTLLRSE